MKFRLALLAVFLFVPAGASVIADDTIRLRNGSELKGKIVEETPDTVTVEYGGSIKELKTLRRSEILSIDRETPDELAFEKLKALFPTGDLMSPEDYDSLIAENFTKFTDRFADSVLVDQVKGMAGRLKEEKAKVEAGAIKLDGKWTTAEEATKDPFDHGAKVLVARMEKAIAESDFTAALEHFDALQKDYYYSIRFGAALEKAKEILPEYDDLLANLQEENATIMKEREENLKSMDAGVRQRTERAFNNQIAAFEATRQAAREQGKTWLPISKWHAESLTEARETLTSETRRLRSIRAEKQLAAATAYATAKTAVAEGKLEEAAKALTTARSNGMKGEQYEELDALIKDSLKAAATAKREAERAEREVAAAAKAEEEAKKKAEEEAEKKRKAAAREAREGGSGSDDDSTAEEDGGGIPFQVLLIGLAVVLGIVTLVAKKFGTKGDTSE